MPRFKGKKRVSEEDQRTLGDVLKNHPEYLAQMISWEMQQTGLPREVAMSAIEPVLRRSATYFSKGQPVLSIYGMDFVGGMTEKLVNGPGERLSNFVRTNFTLPRSIFRIERRRIRRDKLSAIAEVVEFLGPDRKNWKERWLQALKLPSVVELFAEDPKYKHKLRAEKVRTLRDSVRAARSRKKRPLKKNGSVSV